MKQSHRLGAASRNQVRLNGALLALDLCIGGEPTNGGRFMLLELE